MKLCNIKKSRMYGILYLDFQMYMSYSSYCFLSSMHMIIRSQKYISTFLQQILSSALMQFICLNFFFIFQESSSMADRKEGSLSYSEGRQNHTERVKTSKNAKNVIYSRMNGSVGKDVESSGNQSTS